MLEVVFSESAAGSMKMGKKYHYKNTMGSAIGFIGEKPTKEELEKQFEGEAIGGSPDDVVCIGFNLDIGDINGEIDSKIRKQVYRDAQMSVDEERVTEFFNMQQSDQEKLIDAAKKKKGKSIRVWKSNAPFSACGFAYLCHLLKNIDCPINVISLPKYTKNTENKLVSNQYWEEILPGQLYQYLSSMRKISSLEKAMQSQIWEELKIENASLRAVVNGKLISVPEDFYDYLITKEIPDDEFTMGQLLANLLTKYELGVGNNWYADRIDQMITENKLTVMNDKKLEHPYQKRLKRAR